MKTLTHSELALIHGEGGACGGFASAATFTTLCSLGAGFIALGLSGLNPLAAKAGYFAGGFVCGLYCAYGC